MKRKYKIINTTIKPLRRDPKTGADLRSSTEKVGHPVSFRNEKDQVVLVHQSQPRIVDELSEGILRLQRGGFIHIEEIDDVITALRQHAVPPKAQAVAAAPAADKAKPKPSAPVAPAPKAPPEAAPEAQFFTPDLFAPDPVAAQELSADDGGTHPSAARQAKAVEMGRDTYEQEGGREYDGATNPDGDPNFLVTASKKMKRQDRKRS